jgi:hypothetical protein
MTLENDFTWTFWSKSDPGQAQTDPNIIIGNRNNANGVSSGEWIKFTNDRIEFHADGTNASDLQWGAAGPDDIRMPNNDQWYHHVVVKDGDEMKYYRNGVVRNEIMLGLGQQTTAELPFAMGGQAAPDADGQETSRVYLSDVRLYDHPLSAAEIAELAGVSIAGDCNGDGMVNIADANCTPNDQLNDLLANLDPPSLRGDLDGDGTVQFSDFVVLSGNYGQPGEYTDGDFDKDAVVQFSDFVILSGNYGMSGSGGAAAVPEPSSVTLIGLAGLLVMLQGRRWRACEKATNR